MPININEIPEGGRGLKLMWQLADELSYTRTPACQNCLFIGKTFKLEDAGQQDTTPKKNVFQGLIQLFYRSSCDRQTKACQSNHLTPIKKIRLKVKTELSALADVLHWYDQLQNLPIPKEVWWKCQLALAEGFTNAVRHAHRGMPLETPIQLEIQVFRGRIEIRIWDWGQPFDFDARLREKIGREPLKRTERLETDRVNGSYLVPSLAEN